MHVHNFSIKMSGMTEKKFYLPVNKQTIHFQLIIHNS